jgi:hypothetical protein
VVREVENLIESDSRAAHPFVPRAYFLITSPSVMVITCDDFTELQECVSCVKKQCVFCASGNWNDAILLDGQQVV